MLLAGVEIPLGQIHLFVSFVDLLVDTAMFSAPGRAAGNGDTAFLHGPERITDTGLESLPAGFAVDDDELVTAYAVGLFAKGPEETLRCAADKGITGLMALEVIDLLQPVQVEVGDAQAAAILSGQGVTDLVVSVSGVQPGGKILHIHLGDDVVLLGDLPFLELDLLPEIAAGLLSHYFRKSAVARVHFAVRIGKMEMTAAGPLRRPAKNRGDALVNAQADAGIRNSGDPEHARTDEQVRHGPDDVIVLFAYLAAGHPACEGPERPDDGRRIDGVLMLPGTEPAEGIVKMGEQELRIVLAVVLMQKKTRQFRDLPLLRIVCQRGMRHPCTPLSSLPVAIPHARGPQAPVPPCRVFFPKGDDRYGSRTTRSCSHAREADRSGRPNTSWLKV